MVKLSSYNHTFLPYKNIHAGKSGILFAPGPSLDKWRIINRNEVHLGLSWVLKRKDILENLDYFFFGSGYHYVKNIGSYNDGAKFYRERVKAIHPSVKKFASCYRDGKPTGEGNITPEAALEIDATPFDCQIPNASSEFIAEIDMYMMLGLSIVFPALQFMLYTGLSTIRLVGCDNGGDHAYMWNKVQQFIDVEYPNTKIISIDPVTLKGIFIDEYP